MALRVCLRSIECLGTKIQGVDREEVVSDLFVLYSSSRLQSESQYGSDIALRVSQKYKERLGLQSRLGNRFKDYSTVQKYKDERRQRPLYGT